MINFREIIFMFQSFLQELKLRMHALENDVDRLNKGKRNLNDCQDASDDKTVRNHVFIMLLQLVKFLSKFFT